ncbi:MAG TPA: 30S ribosomal protein S8 [Patescibacteria group bacterium]|nr:30S ribosomal protein S8 [Patescibacteria group bacterium]
MDTISDMLTRIRNASSVRKPEVVLPYSKFKFSLAQVLAAEGFLRAVTTREAGKFKDLVLELKYSNDGQPTISGISRVSKPGQRIYSKTSEIPRSLGGVGTTIVSTSRGLMTDKSARKTGIGGEVICQIW